MAKILIVDDEPGICELLSSILEEVGHDVRFTLNGLEAKNIVLLFEPDLIISDIKMDPLNGIELLHWVKANFPHGAFIFITGFSDVLLLKEAIDLGAFSLITKPFKEEEILSTVKAAVGEPDENVQLKSYVSDDFCKFDLRLFVSGSISSCSIYVKIREDHFVKLAEKNDPLPREKLIEYQEKKLSYLYVLKDEFGELVGFNMRVMGAISKNNRVPKEKVLNFINYSNSIILEQTFVKNINKSMIEEVCNYSKIVLGILSRKKALFEILVNLKESSSYLYAHSFSTGVLAYLIAKEIGWNSEPILCRIFLAGLLHDIGLRGLKSELLEKNPNLFNDYELEKYRQHPVEGMEILNELGDIPEEVILAAYQHHEFCDGSGYPLGIRKNKISPISKLITVADIVDGHAHGNKDLSLINMKKLVENIERSEKNKYDPLFFNGLKKVLKM